MRTRELYSMLCGDLSGKEIQGREDICMLLTDLLCCYMVKQLYSNLKKKCFNPLKKKNPEIIKTSLEAPPPANHPPEFCNKHFLVFLYSFTTSMYITRQ